VDMTFLSSSNYDCFCISESFSIAAGDINVKISVDNGENLFPIEEKDSPK